MDGLALALIHVVRLLGIAAIVALLMNVLTPKDWVCGIYAILAPLEKMGMPAKSFAVRLMLVLEQVTGARKLTWEALVREEPIVEIAASWSVAALAPRDCVLLMLLVLCLSGGWQWLA